MVPDFLHISPVIDDTILNWVLEGEDAFLSLGLISYKTVLRPNQAKNYSLKSENFPCGEHTPRSQRNPLKLNVLAYPYQLDDPISNFGDAEWYFSYFLKF